MNKGQEAWSGVLKLVMVGTIIVLGLVAVYVLYEISNLFVME